MNAEPVITINGIELSEAHALTIRVALNSATYDLGDDERGQTLKRQFTERGNQILTLIQNTSY